MPSCRRRRWRSPFRSISASCGRRPGRWRFSSRIGPTFLNYFYLSSSVTLVQEEVRPDQRVLSGALLLLVMNLIGMGVGPAYVGAVSDFLHAGHPHHSLQLAFYALAPFYALAVGLFLWLARVLRKEAIAEAEGTSRR